MKVADRVSQIVQACDKLPPFPAVATSLMRLVEASDTNVADIVELISYDQALTANCLKLCNSSYFGLREKVASVDHAVVMIGTRALCELALTISCGLSDYQKRLLGYGLHPGELWRHSVACAQVSRFVLRKLGWTEDAYAYTAALLHDVGKLILDQFVDSNFDQICRAMATGATPVQAEKKVLGIDHSEVGGLLCKSWKFPDSLTDAIRRHHRSLETDGPRLFQVVELSNLIAHVSTYHRAGLDLRIGADVLSRFGLDHQGIQEVIEGVSGELQRAEDLFKIPLLKS